LINTGSLITSGNYSKAVEMEGKIEKLIKSNKFELTRPIAAFVTFER